MYYVIPWFDGFEGFVVCAVSGGERVRYTYIAYIAYPLTTTHSAHHKAFKPIELWNNIVHTTIDSYTGFILSRTHDKHQWLLLQFIILLMMDANCVRNM